jgi:hypothetical protein
MRGRACGTRAFQPIVGTRKDAFLKIQFHVERVGIVESRQPAAQDQRVEEHAQRMKVSVDETRAPSRISYTLTAL